MITPRHITGEWVHVVDDGMVDEDAFPDEARPTGHVVFEPLWPDVATAGEAAYTLTPITAVIADGQLRDVQGREGVWLAGEVGAITVRWKATTYLEYKGERIPYPTLVFDLEADARLTALLQSSEPDEIPWVVDPRIEGLVAEAQQVVAEAQAAVEGLEQLEANAADSASAAASSASAAAESESAAASSASAASDDAADALAARDDTFVARDEAVAAHGGAEAAKSAASGSASEADNHAGRAEAAANAFDLTATSTTGVSVSDASVTVTGDGPAYGLEFTLPRGDKGETGPAGEVSQAQLDAAVASLVDGSPDALDTLSELASALGNDPNFATTISSEIGERAKKTYVDSALADKSDVGHSHAWSEVTSKPAVFPPESHGHAIADVTGLQAALDDTVADWDDLTGKPATFPPASHSHSWGSITSKPTVFPPESHTHTAGEVGLGNVDNTSDANKPVSTATQAALTPLQNRVGAAPATWHWAGTALPTAASEVHAQARVGDFIVAPNLTVDPGWHQITGV